VLATVFLIAIWLDPTQPSRFEQFSYALLATYVAASLAYLLVTWSNWWIEHKLIVFSHLTDIAFFAVMVFVTDGYTSPFFTFFVFILLSATIKWGWRGTAFTGVVVTFLFFLAGWASIQFTAAHLEIMRFLVRGTYLFVLTALFIWFGVNQRNMFMRQLPGLHLQEETSVSALPVERVLDYAGQRVGSSDLTLVWWDEEEPWLNIGTRRGSAFRQEKHGPDRYGALLNPEFSGCAFLFDNERGRVLVMRDGLLQRSSVDAPLSRSLSEAYDIRQGLVMPIKTESIEGVIIASTMSGACVDDLLIAERIGEEVSAAFHRASLISGSEEASAVRTRLSFARDLHDSVAQLLAATSFRVAGINKTLEQGQDIRPEMRRLQQELVHEQKDLRLLIKQLREGAARPASAGLCDSVLELLERVSRQWGARCELIRCPGDLQVMPQLEHDVLQLIREGIANAVRHGKAKTVSISLDVGETGLSLIIADDGLGFSTPLEGSNDPSRKPWSLNERVRELKGSLALYSKPGSTRVTISLPSQKPEFQVGTHE
jgi:signal transduction histidine kinase